jgi:hypothetical protein
MKNSSTKRKKMKDSPNKLGKECMEIDEQYTSSSLQTSHGKKTDELTSLDNQRVIREDFHKDATTLYSDIFSNNELFKCNLNLKDVDVVKKGRSLNSFLLFRKNFANNLRRSGEKIDQRGISAITSIKWKRLTDEEKKVWQNLSYETRTQHGHTRDLTYNTKEGKRAKRKEKQKSTYLPPYELPFFLSPSQSIYNDPKDKKNELEKLITSAKDKLGEDLEFLLEMYLETQNDIEKLGRDSFIEKHLQKLENALTRKMSKEELEAIYQKQKEVRQKEKEITEMNSNDFVFFEESEETEPSSNYYQLDSNISFQSNLISSQFKDEADTQTMIEVPFWNF